MSIYSLLTIHSSCHPFSLNFFSMQGNKDNLFFQRLLDERKDTFGVEPIHDGQHSQFTLANTKKWLQFS